MPDPRDEPLTLTNLHRHFPKEARGELPSTPKSLPTEVDQGKVLPAGYADYVLRVLSAYCHAMTDALRLYLPLPEADRFHSSTARIRLAKGSNRASKTVTAVAETSRTIRNQDPYRKRREGNLLCIAVGKDQDHLADPMWRKLFFPDCFKIVPDEETGLWRSVRPDPADPCHLDPVDLARKHLWKPAPPFLPPDEIAPKGLAYEKKNEGIPSSAALKNGNIIRFYPSGGFPRQGGEIDYAWFDEEIENRLWLGETLRGINSRERSGFVWSYTPQASTPQAYNLYRRAVAGEPDIEAFFFSIEANPYLSDDQKEAFYRDCAAEGDEALAIRYFGKDAIHGRMVYPTWEMDRIGVNAHPIPDNWMRILTIDPGTRFQAALFGAVPPDRSRLEIYAETVIQNKDAYALGREVVRIAGHHRFEAYVIDQKGAQPRPMGRSYGDSTADHYRREFIRAGMSPSRLSGKGFLWGNTDVNARELAVKQMLSANMLRPHRGATGRLDRQMQNRFYDKNNPERRETRTEHELPDCLEYMVGFFDGCTLYYEPPPPITTSELSRVDRAVLKAMKNFKKKKRHVAPPLIPSKRP